MVGLPKVRLIATGGTIAGGVDIQSGKPRSRSAQDLVELIPEVRTVATVEYEDYCRIGSSRMTPELQSGLSEKVNEVLAIEDVSGVVVTHGTDSLEESAFFLELTVNSEKPVVFAAAQRPPTRSDTDGPRNLLNAIRIAGSERARGRGVMVTLNDEIHSGKYVRKTHTISLESFKSGQKGMIGYVDNGQVLFFTRPEPRIVFPPDKIDSKVDLIKLVAGSDAKFVEAAIEKGSSGLIVEAFGRGNIPPAVFDALLRARERGLMVVIASRCFEGRVVIPGEWRAKGLVCAQDLDSLKARILLMICLGLKKDIQETQRLFDEVSLVST
jgi:L-asparaginase